MKFLFLFGAFAAFCTRSIFASEIETGDLGIT